MGRWSQREYDRQVVMKMEKLFQASVHDVAAAYPGFKGDIRFTTFVKNLDTENKAIQSCFQALIQQWFSTRQREERRAERDRAARAPTVPWRQPGEGGSWENPVDNSYSRAASIDGTDFGFDIFDTLDEDPPAMNFQPLQPDSVPDAQDAVLRSPTIAPAFTRVARLSPIRPSAGEQAANAPADPTAGNISAPLIADPATSLTLPLRRARSRNTSPLPFSSRPHSPDPLRLTDDIPLPARDRSSGPSFSPSRARLMGTSAAHPVQRRRSLSRSRSPRAQPAERASSPPRSPSRVWLEEYQQQQNQQAPDEDIGPLPTLRRATNRRFSGLPSHAAQRSLSPPNFYSQRRRGRDEYEEAEEEARRRTRRRLERDDPVYRRAREAMVARRDTRRDGVIFDDGTDEEWPYQTRQRRLRSRYRQYLEPGHDDPASLGYAGYEADNLLGDEEGYITVRGRDDRAWGDADVII